MTRGLASQHVADPALASKHDQACHQQRQREQKRDQAESAGQRLTENRQPGRSRQ
jgi:hypothetical protein